MVHMIGLHRKHYQPNWNQYMYMQEIANLANHDWSCTELNWLKVDKHNYEHIINQPGMTFTLTDEDILAAFEAAEELMNLNDQQVDGQAPSDSTTEQLHRTGESSSKRRADEQGGRSSKEVSLRT